MTASHNVPQALILELYDDQESDDVFCKKIMQALIDGSENPSQLAADFDSWVVGESTKRLHDLTARPDTIERDSEGNVHRRCTPNASGYVDHFFQSFPSLCSVFPPHHDGQTRIVEFLEALMKMPEHKAPDSFPTSGTPGETSVNMMNLWVDRGYSVGFFRRGADEIRSPGSGVETPGSEDEVRWRNYQSAMARITQIGFGNCSFLSGLRDILPSSSGKKTTEHPTWKTCRTSKPEKMAGYIHGAAQWVVWPNEARFVYQQCKQKEKLDEKDAWDTWSMESWRSWKAQFEFFSVDGGKLGSEAQEVARSAFVNMNQIEAEENTH